MQWMSLIWVSCCDQKKGQSLDERSKMAVEPARRKALAKNNKHPTPPFKVINISVSTMPQLLNRRYIRDKLFRFSPTY